MHLLMRTKTCILYGCKFPFCAHHLGWDQPLSRWLPIELRSHIIYYTFSCGIYPNNRSLILNFDTAWQSHQLSMLGNCGRWYVFTLQQRTKEARFRAMLCDAPRSKNQKPACSWPSLHENNQLRDVKHVVRLRPDRTPRLSKLRKFK